jgi:hypothetical protein
MPKDMLKDKSGNSLLNEEQYEEYYENQYKECSAHNEESDEDQTSLFGFASGVLETLQKTYQAQIPLAGLNFSLSNIEKNVKRLGMGTASILAGGLAFFTPETKAENALFILNQDPAHTVCKIEADSLQAGYPDLMKEVANTCNITTIVNEQPTYYTQITDCGTSNPVTLWCDTEKPWLIEGIDCADTLVKKACDDFENSQAEGFETLGIVLGSVAGGIALLCFAGAATYYLCCRANAGQPSAILSINDVETPALSIETKPLLKDNSKKQYVKETPKTYEEKLAAIGFNSNNLDPLVLKTYNSFICPISQEIMNDPVIASDGNTYERKEIQKIIDNNNPTSPLTRAPLNKTLTSNLNLKSQIDEFVIYLLNEHQTKQNNDDSGKGKDKEKEQEPKTEAGEVIEQSNQDSKKGEEKFDHVTSASPRLY